MKKLLLLILVNVLIFSLVACSNSGSQQSNEPVSTDEGISQQESSIEQVNPSKEQEEPSEQSKVDVFIAEYNKVAINPITDAVKVDVTDKESGHYRTEFRLGAFESSEAKTGKIGDVVIDIISYGSHGGFFENDNMRVYADDLTLEQAKEIIKAASKILDKSLTDADVQEVLDYLDENKSANGYYYGDIGLLFSGDLMLKVE